MEKYVSVLNVLKSLKISLKSYISKIPDIGSPVEIYSKIQFMSKSMTAENIFQSSQGESLTMHDSENPLENWKERITVEVIGKNKFLKKFRAVVGVVGKILKKK